PPEQYSGGDPSGTGGTHGRTGGTVADEEDPRVAPDGHLGVHGDAAVAGAQVQRREVFERGPEHVGPEDHVESLDPFGAERGPCFGYREAVAGGRAQSVRSDRLRGLILTGEVHTVRQDAVEHAA